MESAKSKLFEQENLVVVAMFFSQQNYCYLLFLAEHKSSRFNVNG